MERRLLCGDDFVQPHLSGSAKDNDGTSALAENPKGSHLSKHVGVRFPFVWGGGLVRLAQVAALSGTTCRTPHKANKARGVLGHRDFMISLSLGTR